MPKYVKICFSHIIGIILSVYLCLGQSYNIVCFLSSRFPHCILFLYLLYLTFVEMLFMLILLYFLFFYNYFRKIILILFVGNGEIILKLFSKYNLYYELKKCIHGLTNFLMFFDRLFNIHLVEC